MIATSAAHRRWILCHAAVWPRHRRTAPPAEYRSRWSQRAGAGRARQPAAYHLPRHPIDARR